MQLLQVQQDKGNFVCVGLDSDINKLSEFLIEELGPYGAQLEFNKRIIDATKDFAGAYKPNLAFYKGAEGKEVLRLTIAYIHEVAPEIPVILDAKYGDIGNTNDGYVDEVEHYGADAVTIHNYMGLEAMKPFLDNPDKGVIVLCRTSNPGAGEFQDLTVEYHWQVESDKVFANRKEAEREGYTEGVFRSQRGPLYEFVALSVARSWNYNSNCAVVVGATNPAELTKVRDIVGDMPILLPGIGAQGGDLEATIGAGRNSKGQGMIVNNSRSVIFAFASKDNDFTPEQFPEAARHVGLAMHNAIRTQLGLETTLTA